MRMRKIRNSGYGFGSSKFWIQRPDPRITKGQHTGFETFNKYYYCIFNKRIIITQLKYSNYKSFMMVINQATFGNALLF